MQEPGAIDLTIHRSGDVFIVAGASSNGAAWLESINDEQDDDGVFACAPEQAKKIIELARMAGLTVKED